LTKLFQLHRMTIKIPAFDTLSQYIQPRPGFQQRTSE